MAEPPSSIVKDLIQIGPHFVAGHSDRGGKSFQKKQIAQSIPQSRDKAGHAVVKQMESYTHDLSSIPKILPISILVDRSSLPSKLW